MILTKSELIDVIDQLNEAKLMAEAAFLACGGMQLKQEASAMRAVVGAYADMTKSALGVLETALDQEGAQ
jgi:hypothetical protein